MKLKLNPQVIYLTDDWICDGAILVKRSYADKLRGNPLKKYLSWKNGHYYKENFSSETTPDMEQLLPRNRDAQVKVDLNFDTAVPLKNRSHTWTIRLRTAEFPVYVSENYFQLTELGECFATGPKAPLTVQDNGEVVAVIMPIRMQHPLDKVEYPTKEEDAS